MDNSKQIFTYHPRFIILLAVLFILVVVYVVIIFNQKLVTEPVPSTLPTSKILTEQERADMIRQLSATGTTTLSEKEKNSFIKETSAPDVSPKLSDVEKQKIINSLSN